MTVIPFNLLDLLIYSDLQRAVIYHLWLPGTYSVEPLWYFGVYNSACMFSAVKVGPRGCSNSHPCPVCLVMQCSFTSLNKYKSLSQHKIIKASPIAPVSHLEVRQSRSQFSELVIFDCFPSVSTVFLQVGLFCK